MTPNCSSLILLQHPCCDTHHSSWGKTARACTVSSCCMPRFQSTQILPCDPLLRDLHWLPVVAPFHAVNGSASIRFLTLVRPHTPARAHQLAGWYPHCWEQTKPAQWSSNCSLFWQVVVLYIDFSFLNWSKRFQRPKMSPGVLKAECGRTLFATICLLWLFYTTVEQTPDQCQDSVIALHLPQKTQDSSV